VTRIKNFQITVNRHVNFCGWRVNTPQPMSFILFSY